MSPGSGLILLALDSSQIPYYFIPSLGPAPKWCSSLENFTEELEMGGQTTIYDHFKFFTKEELDRLNLTHLIGNNVLRAYMHGFFINYALYKKLGAGADLCEAWCECVLFGDYVDELKRLIGEPNSGMHVVAIQFAKVKFVRDKVYVQNSMNITRIFVDHEIEEAADIIKGLSGIGPQSISLVTLIGPMARDSVEGDFLYIYPKNSVDQIVSMNEEGIYVVCAVIEGFVEGENWWYHACMCHRSVNHDSGAYYCNGCVKHVYATIPRFRVKVNVNDGHTSATIVLFDRDMQYLIEKHCSSLVSTAKGENRGSYPPEFDALKGMKLLFKVENKMPPAGSSDETFRVKRVCKELSIVEAFERENSANNCIITFIYCY